MILRLSEQYLIRSEARAQIGDLNGAILDLNAVRCRAGLDGTSAATQSDIIGALLHERRWNCSVSGGRDGLT